MTDKTMATTLGICVTGLVLLAYWLGTRSQLTPLSVNVSKVQQDTQEIMPVEQQSASGKQVIVGHATVGFGHESRDQIEVHDHTRQTEVSTGSQPAGPAADTYTDNEKLISLMSLVQEAAKNGDPYDLGDVPPRFAQLLHESPELIGDLIHLFGQHPNGFEKEVLHSLLVEASMMLGNNEIEKYAVDLISSGNYDHDNSLYGLTSDIGIRTSSSRERLLQKLPSLSAPMQLRSVIESIVPQIVNAEEKQQVVAELSLYLNHPEPQVRGAAVKAVGTWGGSQQAYVIADGLTDTAEDVRHAAAAAALRSGIRTEDIKTSLLAIMNNHDEVIDIRQQAHIALTNYALEGQEYDDFYQFNLELENLGDHAH